MNRTVEIVIIVICCIFTFCYKLRQFSKLLQNTSKTIRNDDRYYRCNENFDFGKTDFFLFANYSTDLF